MEYMWITECPRDAMQGLPYFIPTGKKEEYLRALLTAGFSTIDIGSFVSPTAIPQLSDTGALLSLLAPYKSDTRFLVIIGNERGAIEASRHPAVDILGFPWSISGKFLQHNLRSDLVRSRQLITSLIEMCRDTGKELQVYISMAFGNPYDDPWNEELLIDAIRELHEMGVGKVSLSDTVGFSNPESIRTVFTRVLNTYSSLECSFHLHTSDELWKERVKAAWDAGCRHFDSVLNGMGGCPMSAYRMIGNLNTMQLLSFCEENGIAHGLNLPGLHAAAEIAGRNLSSGVPLVKGNMPSSHN